MLTNRLCAAAFGGGGLALIVTTHDPVLVIAGVILFIAGPLLWRITETGRPPSPPDLHAARRDAREQTQEATGAGRDGPP